MLKLNVNGRDYEIKSGPDTPLLWVLRDELGLTGTKFGCGMAQCGACMVHVAGTPAFACVTPVSSVEGQAVTTVEGINDQVAGIVQTVWAEMDVPQCGYCQSGQVMAATALLRSNKNPTDADIDGAMSGNLCRCATYSRIRRAIHEASRRLEA